MSVSRETREKLDLFVSLLIEENDRQNLIAKSSVPDVWNRHIEDALQLIPMLQPGTLADIGSGPGLPGMVLAIANERETTLIEPRRRRVEFLERCKAELGVAQVKIVPAKSTSVRGHFDNITARAVAELATLLDWTWHLAHSGTRFVLPKGRSAKTELESATRAWQGDFRLEKSLTSDDAFIIVGDRVRPRGKR